MQRNGDKIFTTLFFFKKFYFLFWITMLVPSFHVKLSSIHWYFKVNLFNVLCLELPCYHGLTPTNSQAKPSLGGMGDGIGKVKKREIRKALILCTHCSTIMKTSLCYQSCLQHKSKVPHLLWKKFTLPQWKPAHLISFLRNIRNQAGWRTKNKGIFKWISCKTLELSLHLSSKHY